jgi:deoxycytidylate deaminase
MIDWLPELQILPVDPKTILFYKKALASAYVLATRSQDPRTQVAAQIYTCPVEMSIGYYTTTLNCESFNEIIPKVPVSDVMLNSSEDKLHFTVHAETNCIFKFKPEILEKSLMIAPWYACSDCAKNIILSKKINMICGHKQAFERTPEKWRRSIQCAFKMLHANNIACYAYDGKIFDDPSVLVRMDGVLWNP